MAKPYFPIWINKDGERKTCEGCGGKPIVHSEGISVCNVCGWKWVELE